MSTSPVPGTGAVQCASDEVRVTLNYANTIAGRSELIFWIILPDGSRPDGDINAALVGSGTYMQLPAGGTVDTPIQLFIRRSVSSTDWQFNLASASLSVQYVQRVVFSVFDYQGELAVFRAVRMHTYCISKYFYFSAVLLTLCLYQTCYYNELYFVYQRVCSTLGYVKCPAMYC